MVSNPRNCTSAGVAPNPTIIPTSSASDPSPTAVPSSFRGNQVITSLVTPFSTKGCPMAIPVCDIRRTVKESVFIRRSMAKTPVNSAPMPTPYLNPFLSMTIPAGMDNTTCTKGKTSVNHMTLLADMLKRSSTNVSMAAKFSQ